MTRQVFINEIVKIYGRKQRIEDTNYIRMELAAHIFNMTISEMTDIATRRGAI